MQYEQYQALAIKTESVPQRIEMNQAVLYMFLKLAQSAAEVMDIAKRRIFYGKEMDLRKLAGAAYQVEEIAGFFRYGAQDQLQGLSKEDMNVRLSDEDMVKLRAQSAMEGDPLATLDDNLLNIRLLHAAIGTFTESGEQIEALIAQFEGKGLDITNYGEEMGDVDWYGAIGKDELFKLSGGAITNGTIQLANIVKLQGNEKLKGRYSAGDFDAVAALQRDLASERALLEQNLSSNDTLGEDQ